jgi:azurin
MIQHRYVVYAIVAFLLCALPGVGYTQAAVAGITVTPTTGLATTEDGGTAMFSVVLRSEPTANVVVNLKSLDLTEGTVSPATLTFTDSNWNIEQPVLVTGVNDAIDDGDVDYTIETGPVTSADANYHGIAVADVIVTNTDDADAFGVNLTATNLTTSETLTSATFKVALNSQPTANVTIGLSSSDLGEGTVSPTSLTFTPTNWNIMQTVTVKGVNDFEDDGDSAYSIVTAAATSTDANYGGFNAADVSVTNTDNDTSDATVSPTTLVTTENGGSATFKVALTSKPSSDVTIALSSSDTGEGTVLPASLTFTTLNWNTQQSVTVKGVADTIVDGPIEYSIVTGNMVSSDTRFSGEGVADVTVTNTDTETAKLSASSITLNESAGTALVNVVLSGTPVDGREVMVNYTTSDGTAKLADGDFQATSGTLTFVSTGPTVQTITVPVMNDTTGETAEVFNIVLSAPINIALASPSSATVKIPANDELTFNPSSVSVAETIGNATFTVKLNGVNTVQDVSVVYTTSDGSAIAPGDYTSTAATVTIPKNQTSKTFTVPIINDATTEGDETFTVALSNPSNASVGTPGTATVTILANDTATPGVVVTAAAGLKTTEAGGSVSFKVVLKAQPAADVTVNVASSDTTEGTVSPASLAFTTSNWNVAQTVSVRGFGDLVDDGNIVYTVTTTAASTDTNYDGLTGTPVSITNLDDDTAGIYVTPVSNLYTTEAGGTASFRVVLKSQPTSDVMIALSSSDTTEGTVSPASLTFTVVNWKTQQTVTVKGVGDTLVDGNKAYTITGTSTSSDANYHNKATTPVSVTNRDDEMVKLSTGGITINESAGTASVNVVLSGQPEATVTVAYTTKNGTALAGSDYTAKASTLTFTAGGSLSQTITVPITNDTTGENNEAFSIVLSAPAPAGVVLGNPSATIVTIPANDVVAFTTTSVSVAETSATATFTVKLNGASTQSVAVNYATSNGTATAGADYTAKSGTLLFAAGETTKTFTVPITNDLDPESSETVNLTLTNPVNASLGTSTATLTILAND